MLGRIAALWGLGGVVGILGFAIYRLANKAMGAFPTDTWAWYHWVVAVVAVVFMAHSEGYKGFQKSFSPRTAARVRYLVTDNSWLRRLLAPVFCMGYFHATKRTRIVAFVLPVAIFLVVMLMELIPNPWRGIIDLGVVVGLSWGVISLILFSVKALMAKSFPHSPETPV